MADENLMNDSPVSEEVMRNNFDELLFEGRNREYGAYVVRKKYRRSLFIALSIATSIMLVATIAPFIYAKLNEKENNRMSKELVMEMENMKAPEDEPPPPPPPPPMEELAAQIKYVAPVVVDSVKEEDVVDILSLQNEVKDEEVGDTALTVQVDDEGTKEIEEVKKEEVFFIVEEMPLPPGGEEGLRTFVAQNVQYPNVARENNIQGKVYVRFEVTNKGKIDQVTVLRGVHPSLDEEAVRVIKLLPDWKPGKQNGKAVNVWYTMPINFTLQQ